INFTTLIEVKPPADSAPAEGWEVVGYDVCYTDSGYGKGRSLELHGEPPYGPHRTLISAVPLIRQSEADRKLADAAVVNNKYSELIGKHSLEAAKAKGALAEAEARVKPLESALAHSRRVIALETKRADQSDSYMQGRRDCFKENHPRIRDESDSCYRTLLEEYNKLQEGAVEKATDYRTLVEGVRKLITRLPFPYADELRTLLDREVKG
ncbi:hypothetical protein LCGC14_1853220, partial [marine sediment metagenome]